jgi:hypothetical protein
MNDTTALIGLYKTVAGYLIGAGFIFAGLGVIKKAISNPDRMREGITTYIVALIVYILIWSLI